MRKEDSNKFRATVSLLIGLIVLGYSSRDLTAQQHPPSECEDLKKLIKKQEATRIQDQKALNNCLAHQGSCSQFLIDDLNNSIGLLDEEIISLLMDYTSCNVLQIPERSNWIPLAPEGRPAKRWEHKSVYDAPSNRMIMFGGKIPSTDYADDVWVLQHANGLDGNPVWIQLRPEGRAPMGRHMHTAVYDPTNNRMIVFGGHAGAAGAGGNFLADVWLLKNANGLGGAPAWVQLETTGMPPAGREWHTAVYDAASNRMIIFGGVAVAIGNANDVWVLKNANGLGGTAAWVQLNPTGAPPARRAGHTVVYDAASNRMVLFGGGGGQGPPFFNDVWVLEHANGLGGNPSWIQLNQTGTPPSVREDHTAIYDTAKNQMVVFGGWQTAGVNQFYFSDVWMLKNANGLGGIPEWGQFSPAGTPPSARELATAVYDLNSNRMIVFGGSYSPNDPPNCGSGACTNDVWVLSHVP